jgi:hypothetical protein
MASAVSWTYTNDTDAWIDNSGSFPPSNGWFQLLLPDWYDASKVTSFTISMHGDDDNSSSYIDVWLSTDKTQANSVKIDAFNAPLYSDFEKEWNIPLATLIPVGGTLSKDDFSGLDYFYIGYGCHFTHEWSKVEIEQTSVPEPTTMLLLGLGLVGLAGIRRKMQ